MKDFFTELKQYILDNHSGDLETFIKYHETLKQNEDSLSQLINDCSNHYFDIEYNSPDEDSYYDNGKLTIRFYEDDSLNWQESLDFSYEIELREEMASWGYCNCNPSDKGYDVTRKCCGENCDWYAPQIDVRRVNDIVYSTFKGTEKDLWELEDQWKDNSEEHRVSAILEEVDNIQAKIDKLIKQKTMLEDNLK